LKPQVVGIHSTALTPAQLAEMGQAGMKIVWSPLSNLLLYGKTTDIPTALANHIPVALAPDWSPSGSANLLGELKVADRVNRERFGGVISDAQLVAMATSVPASIAGLGDKIGTIAPGLYADLVVVRPSVKGAYRAVIEAQPADVLLTTISGAALYGDPALVGGVAQKHVYVTVSACGAPRQLAIGDDATTSESLDQIAATFAGDAVSSVIPLFQCTSMPEMAFN
jgi:5-methylthioadenosine/S-adenosylhomocysteine deaminase